MDQVNEELLAALREIANPVQAMRARLQDGEQLNGLAAMQLAESPEYLRNIAKAAIEKFSSDPTSNTATYIPREQVTKWRSDIAHAAADIVERASPAFGDGDWYWLEVGIRQLAHYPPATVTVTMAPNIHTAPDIKQHRRDAFEEVWAAVSAGDSGQPGNKPLRSLVDSGQYRGSAVNFAWKWWQRGAEWASQQHSNNNHDEEKVDGDNDSAV